MVDERCGLVSWAVKVQVFTGVRSPCVAVYLHSQAWPTRVLSQKCNVEYPRNVLAVHGSDIKAGRCSMCSSSREQPGSGPAGGRAEAWESRRREICITCVKRFGFRAVSLGCITAKHRHYHWYYDIHLHTTSSTVGISLDWHIEYCTGDFLRQQRSDPGQPLPSDL